MTPPASRSFRCPVRRVMMTTDAVGGVWTYSLELARALGEHGVEVFLAAMGALPNSNQRAEAGRVENVRLVESSFRLEWMRDSWDDVQRAGEWLLSLEDCVTPDVIHLNGYCHAALPWHAPVLSVGHSCVLSWWLAVKGEPAPATWDRYGREVKRGLHAADMVVAPSAAMLRKLEENYGPFGRSRVIPNARMPERFIPSVKEPFVLSAGRLWDEAKNVALLARVAPRLPWPVYVAGDAKHPNGAERRIRNVHALGPLPSERLAAWLGRASIFVLPARYEPFGLSILEAALSGCALVLGDIPSLRENWEGVARFVPPDDEASLESAIKGLIRNESMREALSHLGRLRALEFTPRRMAAGYLSAYREVMQSHQRFDPELSPVRLIAACNAPRLN